MPVAKLVMLVIAVIQGAVVGYWCYQAIHDPQRPVDQRWVPRHWPAFIWLQSALVVATVPMIFLLND